jgi:hypothetical protein
MTLILTESFSAGSISFVIYDGTMTFNVGALFLMQVSKGEQVISPDLVELPVAK